MITQLTHRLFGFTLVELMITLLLTGLLVSGFFTVYLQVKTTHQEEESELAILDEALLLRLFWQQSIEGTGYMGCALLGRVPVWDALQKVWVTSPILLFSDDLSALSPSLQRKIKPGTQVLELRRMNFELGGLITEDPNHFSITTDAPGLKTGDRILISDCAHAEINQVSTIHVGGGVQTISLETPLQYRYGPWAYVGAYQDFFYLLGATGRKRQDNTPIYALYLIHPDFTSEEVSDFVSDFKVEIAQRQGGKIVYATDPGDYTLTDVLGLRLTYIITPPYLVNGKTISQNIETYVHIRGS